MWLWLGLTACDTGAAYIVEGTVMEVTPPTQVVISHEEIQGLMGPMTMPFQVAEPAMLEGVTPGDRVYARLVVGDGGGELVRLRVTGHGPPPEPVTELPAPVQIGQTLPGVDVPIASGGTARLGAGQRRPTALTFLYTTCPLPAFCPATVTRLQALAPEIRGRADVLVVTLDPAGDTLDVLSAFATTSGADPEVWNFGRLEADALEPLVARAALPVTRDGQIVHGTRLLVLDANGALIERYDDNGWPLERVVSQLLTGGPAAPVGSIGTLTAPSP